MANITGTIGDDDGVSNPVLDGTIDDDTILGLSGNDILNGGAGDDYLSGDDGYDELHGGLGNDTLVFRFQADNDLFDGGDNVDTFEIDAIIAGVQDLTNCTFQNLEIMNADFNSVIVLPGQLEAFDSIMNIGIVYHDVSGRTDLTNRIASGEVGRFAGQSGRDVFIIAGADTGWELDGLGGNDRLVGGEGDDTIDGGSGNDNLFGRGGNDELSGAAGNDTMNGGAGDDVFRILIGGTTSQPEQDVIIGGSGVDTVINNTFGAYNMHGSTYTGVEVLVAGGVYANAGQLEVFSDIQNLSLLNHVTAGTTDLTGRVSSFNFGSFAFNGSAGDDTLIITDAVGVVRVNSSAGDDRAFTGAFDDNIIGGSGNNLFDAGAGDDNIESREGNDTIFGRAGDDRLFAGADDDLLVGGAGADELIGFSGFDTASYQDALSGVLADLGNAANNAGDALGDTYSSIEALLGSAFNDDLRGDAGHNTIRGGQGDDTLTGDLGDDLLDGNGGRDTASFAGAIGVTVDLRIAGAQATGVGNDTLVSINHLTGSQQSDVLNGNGSANVLKGGGGADTLNGNGGHDSVIGGGGSDSLFGQGGNDFLSGQSGNDRLIGGSGNDTLNGGNGSDYLNAGNGTDILLGGDGDDTLLGRSGDDQLTGGAGVDVLTGHAGNDRFIFLDVADSTPGSAGRDKIKDFTQGSDLIDVSAIDAVAGGGDQAFAFIGAGGFSGTAGELRYVAFASSTIVKGDVDGDGSADFEVFLKGSIALAAGDFLL
ncbi:Bifunctional hemolysin/adenylate cyclase precursor [Pseudoruegeria aquimaris]|uniref:Bifunctional hemolysin/adenylate cyclase n=1 Tax=Pseudoruegeria aquimaris TaxID=393663 RepID=A0A1Y5TLJ6_9RHOB|nr:hypothetical protein [Pseudoruegeria aquimaris]SLN64954.1 Bifunctional hemolysin/adenylate cyclase precursor [Pseudoruegeria aquimaris]